MTNRKNSSHISNNQMKNNNKIKYNNSNTIQNRINHKNIFNNEFCLIPVSHKYKSKFKKKELNLMDLKQNIDNENFKHRNKNIILNVFSKKKKLNIYGKKRTNETEDNDMKAKIRFINLKRDLLDENLKINKMFGTFQRQILELEKLLNSKMNHL